MAYKSFTFGVIIRIMFILVNLVCLAFIFARTDLFFNQLILLLLLILQVYNLIHFVTQTNRDLSRFLLAIRTNDYAVQFNQSPIHASFQELNESFGELIGDYQKIAAQKESQYQYFKLMMEYVEVGIMSLNSKQEMVLVNKAAAGLLNVPSLSTWQLVQTLRPAFTQAVNAIPASGSRLLEIQIEGEVKQFSVSVTQAVLLGEPFRLITFQDIKSEIEQKEIEAWHKLIRILTHEIMNSVTPVVSLTETMLMIVEEEGKQKKSTEITEENIADIRFSLKTIQKRSGGMLHFLEDYRRLTKIPVPHLETVQVQALFETVIRLMQGEVKKQHVNLYMELQNPELSVTADARLIEQVLINLLTNSLQAFYGIQKPFIRLKASRTEIHIILEVSDNGCGIDLDKTEKIFIPFYSTKAEGSGIGLPVSRQIMHLHGGTIKVSSQLGIQTTFQLIFPIR